VVRLGIFDTGLIMETIDEVNNNSVEALAAHRWPIIPHHFFNQSCLPVRPQMISWFIIMIETNIRDATLVGMLTGTGIGILLSKLYYTSLNYHAASLVVVLIVITIISIELLSK